MALQGEEKKAYQREYMARKRALVSGNPEVVLDDATVETGVVTSGTEVVEVSPRTRTDALFEADRPEYYIYDSGVKERSCWRCGKGFKTQMELNKFCSPECKDGYLDEAFGKLRAEG